MKLIFYTTQSGKISYRSYWAYVIFIWLENKLKLTTDNERLTKLNELFTIQDLCKETGIRSEDILSTLHSLNLIKYWKGQHVISISRKVIENQLSQSKRILLCNPSCLTWEPATVPSKGLV
jgi:hypothetical protein